MTVLRMQGVGVAWSASIPVLESVSFVLDEPTNHMDLPSVERLEHALETYPGCVLLVTRDEIFAQAIGTRTLMVREGTVR